MELYYYAPNKSQLIFEQIIIKNMWVGDSVRMKNCWLKRTDGGSMNKRERVVWGMELSIIFIMLILLTVANLFLTEPMPYGEWDDFALVTVSLLHDGNFTVSQEDIAYAREVLPEWNHYIDSYRMSGYHADNGDELSWYFPSYSVLCLPVMWVLRLFGFSGTNTFVITNILLFISALLVICFQSKFREITKLGIIMALCANSVIIYPELFTPL